MKTNNEQYKIKVGDKATFDHPNNPYTRWG